MREELVETARQYSENQDRLVEIENEINESRQQRFGDESEDTEKKARQLFDEIGRTNGESSKTEKLDSLHDEKEKLQEDGAEIESNLLELLVDIRFPLDGTVQGDQQSVEFPFSESIDPAILDAISAALEEDMRNGKVEIQTDGIIADTASTDDAIELVEDKILQIREQADDHLDVPAQVQKIKGRDPKVAAMLYVLWENDNEPMSKSEMEDEIGLNRGDLRGQLYYVLENDPYLENQDGGVTLKPNGVKVIERFVEQHGIPELIANGDDSKTDGEGEKVETAGEGNDSEEVTAHE